MSIRETGMSCLLISLLGVTLSICATASVLPGVQAQTISLDYCRPAEAGECEG